MKKKFAYKPFYFQINETKKADGTMEIDFKGQFNSSDVNFISKDLPEEDCIPSSLLIKCLPSKRLLEAYMLARWSELEALKNNKKMKRADDLKELNYPQVRLKVIKDEI